MEKIRLHKRECNRYQLPSGSYMNFLSEGNETSGFLIDLSLNGASFEYIFMGDKLTESNRVNIILDKAEFRINNIPCRFIYDINAAIQKYDPVSWHRVGCRFGELTVAQKQHLRYLIEHYCAGNSKAQIIHQNE